MPGLDLTQTLKVLKGAGIAMAGAGLTYFAEWAGTTDFGVWTPLVVAGLSSATNYFRKLLA